MLEIREEIAARYEISGEKMLLNIDLVKMILSYILKSQPVEYINDLANKLIEKFDNLDNLVKADKEDLKSMGIDEDGALFFNIIGDIGTRLYRDRVIMKNFDRATGKNALVSYLRGHIAFKDRENFVILLLDSQNKILGSEVLFEGTLERSSIYPREIMKQVLKYDAKGIIFAHNHPSGLLKPSKSDIEVTEKMYKALKNFDVNLIDHLIITKEDSYSFLENLLI